MGAAASAVEMRISMISRLEIVLSDDALSALCPVSTRVQEGYSNPNPNPNPNANPNPNPDSNPNQEAFTAPLPLLLAQRTRSPHAIVNETGVELFYWQAAHISPISALYLPYISPISPLYLLLAGGRRAEGRRAPPRRQAGGGEAHPAGEGGAARAVGLGCSAAG